MTGNTAADVAIVIAVGLLILGITIATVFKSLFIKVGPDKAIVRSGQGGLRVASGDGMFVIPMVHRYEFMDLTLKSFEIHRQGSEGLICADNIRADIKTAFFIRVDKTPEKMKEVAQSIGAERCSQIDTLRELFDAKFSEALKTVGKQFQFVELYTQREKFKEEILKVIGTDLNGYSLDDAAIDYLEQTPIEKLSPTNILDAEGIKKITELTSGEKVKENQLPETKKRRSKSRTSKPRKRSWRWNVNASKRSRNNNARSPRSRPAKKPPRPRFARSNGSNPSAPAS